MPRRKQLGFPLRVAAIDVGSNAIRLVAAEFAAAREYQVLALERFPVRLGHDVFLTGRLTGDAMSAAVSALGSAVERVRALKVPTLRAVATSAVRESKNGERFIQRVREGTGLTLEVISGGEEARLVHLAVGSRVQLGGERWLIVDLGGGSVEVSLADANGILWSESHTMGSVRLLEELAGVGDEPGRFGQILTEYVLTLRIPGAVRGRAPAAFIATGGNAETLAKLAGKEPDADGVAAFSLGELRAIIGTLSRLSFRQRVDELGLREDRADVILPAAIVYERLCTLAGTDRILAPFVGIREGVLFDTVDELTGQLDHHARQELEMVASLLTLGRRYAFDEPHGAHVARLALSLFDQLAEPLGFEAGERRLLHAASALHDIGAYVSYKKHHRHSLYLISNSELPGFSPREMLVVANTARYHRKSEPGPTHQEFTRLPSDEQRRVRRMAAILRLADALDREHRQNVTRVSATRRGKQLLLRLAGDGDLLLERWALQKKSDFFRDVFGIKVKVLG